MENARIYGGPVHCDGSYTARLFLLFLLYLIQPVECPAQDLNFTFEHVEVPNSQVETKSIIEDDFGFIWFGRADGLYRYNGLSFKLFQHNPDDTTSVTYGRPLLVVKGKNRDIWIGSNTGGVSRLDIDTYRFQSFRHDMHNSRSLGGNNIGGILDQDNGTVWVGSDLFCLNRIDQATGSVDRFYPAAGKEEKRYSTYLGSLVQDPANADVLWIGAPFGVYRFRISTSQFQLFRFQAFNLAYKPYPVSICIDDEGIVWASSVNGIARIDPATGDIREIGLCEIAPENYYSELWLVSDIQRLSANEILVLTHHHGIIAINTETLARRYVNNDPEYFTGANFFFQDRKGNTWTIHGSEILRAYPPEPEAKHLSLAHLRGMNWSRSFLKVPGENTLFIGTLAGEGLLKADIQRKEVLAYPYAFDEQYQRDIFMRDLAWGNNDEIYIGSDNGLLRLQPSKATYTKLLDTEGQYDWQDITALVVCGGRLIFADSDTGVFEITEEKETVLIHRVIPLETQVNDLECINDRLALGTADGVYSLDQSGNLELIAEGLSVSDILAQDTVIWVGTMGQGLYRMRLDSGAIPERFTSDYGSGTNLIYHLELARNGHLWLNTDGGTMQFDPATGTFILYREMGVGKRGPIAEMPNGSFVTGAHRAIRYFEPEDYLQRGHPPKPYITKIDIANVEEDFSTSPDNLKSITLRPNERELIIEFDAINFNRISTTDFYYRIHGLNDTWRNIKNQRYLNINNLNPGKYQLEISAINAYGGKSGENKKLEIVVEPPVYQLPWFQALLVFLVLAGGIMGYGLLKRRREKQLHERTVQYFVNSRYGQDSVNEILWDVARNVISRLDFEDCVVYLYDEKTDSFQQKAAYGLKNPRGREILNPIEIRFGEGIVGSAAREQQPVLVHNVAKDPRYIVDIGERGSEIAVPIIHQGTTIGVIDSEHSKRNFFTRAHANVLSRIAQECSHKIAAAQSAEALAEREKALLGVQKEVAELKLTALQAQMNPHFIFNSLNSINWYILKNRPAEASIYLTKFSKLVRLILDNSKHLSVPVDQELKALRLYLDLESMRFENTFDYEILIDEEIELEEIEIPPLILQPFVENAIWHGLMPKKEKGHLLIQVFFEGNYLKCIVQDNGIGRRAAARIKASRDENHKSKGMQLTSDRIKLLHKNYLDENMIHVIDLEDASGNAAGTRVEVMLPV